MNAGTAPGLAENQRAAVRRTPERAPALRAGLGLTSVKSRPMLERSLRDAIQQRSWMEAAARARQAA